MPFLRSRFVDQGSDYHFSHDFPAFSPLIVGAQSKCHFCGPVSFGKAQTFVFFMDFLHFRFHTEAHPRCHFCGTVSIVKARTFIFPMDFLTFSLSY